METILLEAKAIGQADAGSLYIRTKEINSSSSLSGLDSLGFAEAVRQRAHFHVAGRHVPPGLCRPAVENHTNIVSEAALTGKTINIIDAYSSTAFKFTGTKKFDRGTGYRSKSFLTIPLKNAQNYVIGVLQLINSIEPQTGNVVPFGRDIEPLVEALASQAAVALKIRI